MKEVYRIIELKEGSKWIESRKETDALEIYRSLAFDLINKKIHNASFIRSIKRVPQYDGTQKITVTYDNQVRSIYQIADH